MILDRVPNSLRDLVTDLLQADELFFWLLIILTCLVIVLDAFSEIARKKQRDSGIEPEIRSVITPSSIFKETKTYVSQVQLLAGTPDALLVENGYIIPVERKAFGNKMRDRHIIQLLVYMRLIEEFEGKKPPYGYLILGKNKRKIKVLNTQKKQDWLQYCIDEMQGVLAREIKATASPHKRKCAKCNVRNLCKFKID